MPRRPSKKSGLKKAKGSGKPPRGVDKRDASMGRWETADDIPMDEEDQFNARRDKILLEGEEQGASDDGDEDEVFALEGLDQPSDEDDGEDYAYEDEDEEPIAPPKASTSKSKKKQKKGAPPSSSSSSEEEEEDESWGAKKSAYYADNADLIDSDDEEANELEEAEARRLQLRARAALDEEDFGIGELSLRTPHAEDAQGDELQFDDAPATALPTDKTAVIRHLEQTNPETLALARDWEIVANAIEKAQFKMEQMSSNPSSEPLAAGMLHLYHQTLLSYAANLAFYLHLRASSTHAAHPERLRDHPVMSRLLSLKQALATLEELDFAPSDSDQSDLSGDDGLLDDDLEGDIADFDLGDDPLDITQADLELMTPAERHYVKEMLFQRMLDEQKRGGLGDLDVSSMFDIPAPDPEAGPSKPKKKKKSTRDVVEDTETPALTKVKKKATKPKPVFDLIEPDFGPRTSSGASSSTVKSGPTYTDAFGELNALPAVDAQDKKARKRSLQFYTARVNKSGARREGAAAANAGGDEDLPYKPRERKKVERGTRGMGGEDLEAKPNGTEEKKGTKRARDDDEGDEGDAGEGEGEDGYYALVAKRGKERKETKRTAYEADRAAERAALADSSSGDADAGPRGITRAILKNRGLTPKRSKAVRNPRVKKRMRYDAAQKRVASQRPVFKAGVDASSYAGEKTGISRVIKSTKL